MEELRILFYLVQQRFFPRTREQLLISINARAHGAPEVVCWGDNFSDDRQSTGELTQADARCSTSRATIETRLSNGYLMSTR